jgi:hypothetical protein
VTGSVRGMTMITEKKEKILVIDDDPIFESGKRVAAKCRL